MEVLRAVETGEEVEVEVEVVEGVEVEGEDAAQ